MEDNNSVMLAECVLVSLNQEDIKKMEKEEETKKEKK